MREDQKGDEQRALDQFLAAWHGRAEIASVAPGKPPAPDFVGTLADGRGFGLELVTVTDRTMAHARSLLQDKFKPELIAAAEAASVSATFALHFEEWEIQRLEKSGRRRELVDLFVRLAQEVGGQVRDYEDLDGIDQLTIHRRSEGVNVIIARHVQGRGWNEVQRFIAQKDKKADAYRRSLSSGAQLWLLLVAGTNFENGVEIPPRLPFDTMFDRVFFLDHWAIRAGHDADKVAELLTRRLPAAPGD